MVLPKVEGLLYLSTTRFGVGMVWPGQQSGAEFVGPRSVRGATYGVCWTRNAFVTVAPPLSASPVERVGVKGGCEWVPVGVRVGAQNVVYAAIRGNQWERSLQKCGVGHG